MSIVGLETLVYGGEYRQADRVLESIPHGGSSWTVRNERRAASGLGR